MESKGPASEGKLSETSADERFACQAARGCAAGNVSCGQASELAWGRVLHFCLSVRRACFMYLYTFSLMPTSF